MAEIFRPIQVAIDGNEANCAGRVGSNVYAFEILRALEKITARARRQFQITVFLASKPELDMPPERSGWKYKVVGPRVAWTQLGLPLYLFVHQMDFDVFFTPGHYAPRWCAVPFVNTVMDLAFIPYPELFRARDLYKLENWTRYSVKHAQKVVCISRFTRGEVRKYYGRALSDLLVAYPALSGKPLRLSAAASRQILRDLHVGPKYFLYLGTLQPRKNIVAMIEAFEKLHEDKRFVDYQLVLAGKNGWLTGEIEKKIMSSPVSQKIVLTGFVSEVQKAALLSHAMATLNLGIYEGFGIPSLESLAYGVLPIVANNTSMIEVVGVAGLGVNPFRVSSIAKAMVTAACMTATARARWARLAVRQIQKFSYERSADLILTLLTKVVRQTRK